MLRSCMLEFAQASAQLISCRTQFLRLTQQRQCVTSSSSVQLRVCNTAAINHVYSYLPGQAVRHSLHTNNLQCSPQLRCIRHISAFGQLTEDTATAHWSLGPLDKYAKYGIKLASNPPTTKQPVSKTANPKGHSKHCTDVWHRQHILHKAAHGLWAETGRSYSTTSKSADTQLSQSLSQIPPSKIRSLCIIAHIDHGKTTLADQLLRQAHVINARHQAAADNGSAITVLSATATLDEDLSLDSGELERERGITILSKVTSFMYKGHVINLVDTPGHADFGGEVERVLGLVDGAILVVDASEGALAQTKFVLGKALARGLSPMVLLNKVDKPSATAERCSLVESDLLDLFISLGANDQQLEFPLLYASARQGWASKKLPGSPTTDRNTTTGMEVLLDAIIQHVPPPTVTADSAFSLVVAMVDRDPYVGRVVTGRIHSGQVTPGDMVKVLAPKHDSSSGDGKSDDPAELHKVVRITKRVGMQDIQLFQGMPGDIVSLYGIPAAIGDTVAAREMSQAIDVGRVDPPTLRMVFAANDSPFSGKAGKAVTGRVIGERLISEAETSVSLTVQQLPGATERYEVCARGEMQLAVLIEGMRRQGYELAVSPPAVLTKTEGSQLLEPVEEVVAELNAELAGQVIEMLSVRRGELLDMLPAQGPRQRLVFRVPSRGLIGFKPLFVNLTRGEGLLTRAFLGYEPHKGNLGHVRKGVLISTAQGPATRHALTELQKRGVFFIHPGEEVYEGQIVGEHSRDEDLDVNPTRAKAVSNVRSIVKEITVPLAAPRLLTLEEAIGYVATDELIEVTPEAVRIRKLELSSEKRKTARRRKQ